MRIFPSKKNFHDENYTRDDNWALTTRQRGPFEIDNKYLDFHLNLNLRALLLILLYWSFSSFTLTRQGKGNATAVERIATSIYTFYLEFLCLWSPSSNSVHGFPSFLFPFDFLGSLLSTILQFQPIFITVTKSLCWYKPDSSLFVLVIQILFSQILRSFFTKQ